MHQLGDPFPLANPAPCPHCGELIESSASVTRDQAYPVAGNGSICFHCGGLSVFVMTPFGSAFRKCTQGEYDVFLAEPDNIIFMAQLKAFKMGLRAEHVRRHFGDNSPE